jgi:CPA2 family monovalent cation:H+ antiporter-2
MHAAILLQTGAILGALALAALLFTRLRQSIIPAFILGGIALRPLVGHSPAIELLATFGLVLLLFFMGLEFSVDALLRDRRSILRTGTYDLLICFPVGFIIGVVIGAGWVGSLLLAGGFYISSSAIISKSVIELRRAADPETATGLGILVYEDLFIALFLAVLSGGVLAANPALTGVLWGVAKALLFFGAVLFVALRGAPLLNRVLDVESDDAFILLLGSIVVLLAGAALAAGLSEAIGAFLAGLALAGTAHRARAEQLFAPLQGLFAAIFFLGFGLQIDIASAARLWPAVLLLVVAGVATKLLAGWWAGHAAGLSRRGALSLGFMLVPRGEFSIVLGGIALAAGLDDVASTLALFVLVLSVLGTTGLQFSPQLARWVIPRRAGRDALAGQGFQPDLATFGDSNRSENRTTP